MYATALISINYFKNAPKKAGKDVFQLANVQPASNRKFLGIYLDERLTFSTLNDRVSSSKINFLIHDA